MVRFGAAVSVAAVTIAVTLVALGGLEAQQPAATPPPAPSPKPPTLTDPQGHSVNSELQRLRVEVVAKDLETPWGLAFLPDGRLLVTERPGRLRVIDRSGKVSEPVRGLPRVMQIQDGGLLDVEVHPQYARTGWIYLAYVEPSPTATSLTERAPNNTAMTVIVRGKLSATNEWTDQQTIFRADPAYYSVNHFHFGLRFIFDKQGHLYYSLGDHGVPEDAQDLTKVTGKIHRVNDDGTAPKDNPFVGRAGAVPTIWTYGHRNPQGLAFDPATGMLWSTEHGPGAGDELNLVQRGRNYGWPLASHGAPGRGAPPLPTELPGMESPVVFWTPTLAPGGMAFYSGARYPRWRNQLFITGLGGQVLRRLTIERNRVTHQEVVFDNLGRIRDIVIGPDGDFYVATALPGARLADTTVGFVLRLVPAS